jgi:predicted dehydrogenase
VYESPNDVCDHQVVNLEFANGTTASFTMVAFSSAICERQTRMHFTHGEIIGDMNTFTVNNFRTDISGKHSFSHLGGHGGGDLGSIGAFVKAVKEGKQDLLGTTIDEVVKSHMTVFAAEASRKEGRVIDCAEFEKAVREDFERKN